MAIRGVRVKKIMLGSYERSHCVGKDAFYGMSKKKFVQKLCVTQVSHFSSNSHRFQTKIEIFH